MMKIHVYLWCFIIPFMVLTACSSEPPAKASTRAEISFVNANQSIGLESKATWKYGGPAIADFNQDGIYDMILTNHHIEPTALYYGHENGLLRLHEPPLRSGDVHGVAPGDYDQDGDVDVIISVGGGNGTTPSPPRLLRNDQGKFVDVTESAGIANLGARGRSVRWIDIDLDGDLDLLQIVARQIPGETGPRNIVFENVGDGKFEYRESPGLESIEAERVLVTDINNDYISDLIMFEPLSIWRGDGNFVFENVTQEVLPSGFDKSEFITAVADADFDNDGDRDVYLARGKTYYQIANNSVDLDKNTKRLDLRDEGNTGHDGLSFSAAKDVVLSRFWHWPRGIELNLPVYLGADKTRIDTPTGNVKVSRSEAQGFPANPEETGWYLGHLGNGKWRFEWRLNGNLAWGVRATIEGVDDVDLDWEPQNYNFVPDVLLQNDGGTFTDVSAKLPEESQENNWGVTHGDFDNDGDEDFFVYRFGKLSQRVTDLLLRNEAGAKFEAETSHGAYAGPSEAHGDMGAAFDYDQDGRIDLLSGDDNYGKWNFYQNTSPTTGQSHYLLVNVGYSDKFTDPFGATVTVEAANGLRQTKDVGSAGAIHSQSLLSILHFGTKSESEGLTVTVRWRDGTRKTLTDVSADQLISMGKNPANKSVE